MKEKRLPCSTCSLERDEEEVLEWGSVEENGIPAEENDDAVDAARHTMIGYRVETRKRQSRRSCCRNHP